MFKNRRMTEIYLIRMFNINISDKSISEKYFPKRSIYFMENKTLFSLL